MIKRIISAVVTCSLLASVMLLPEVSASTPYEAYNYNYYEDAVHSPAAYIPERAVTGQQMGAGPLLDPYDLVLDSKGRIYIADTGNKRVLILNNNWELEKELTSYMTEAGQQAFTSPVGLFIDKDDLLYVADSGNNHIIGFNSDLTVRLIIAQPESDLLGAGFNFSPQKIAVDDAKRVYVIASRVFEGIMQFDEDGTFLGYVGTNKVRRDYGEILWRLLSTQAQRAQMVLFIPTEFSNLDMGQRGFIYATNIDINSREPIKRLNPSGEDVLKRYGYFDVRGDIYYRSSVGPSRFVDIKFLGDGLFSALDITQGRIFTYDDEGNLLYVFGANGNQVGTFRTPVAVEFDGHNHYVLDRGKGNVVVFTPTRFGELVNEASRLHYNGYSAEAVPIWREVLELNSNYDIAYIGIGRSLLLQKENEEAIHYFEQGIYREQYSVAFKRYRREQMKEHFDLVMTGLVGLGLIVLLYMIWKSYQRRFKRKQSKKQADTQHITDQSTHANQSHVKQSEGGQTYEG